jgi:chorismate mutase
VNLSDIRAKLDRLDEQIVGRFKDRSRFMVNEAVYRRGAIPIAGHPDASLLDWALTGLERYHATLGRFAVPDQRPLQLTEVPESPVQRKIDLPRLPATAAIAALPRVELVEFYISLLPRFCAPGDDPNNYGETAYADADLLVRINERVYLGGYVAKFKLEREPGVLELVDRPGELRTTLRDIRRENAVIAGACETASRYKIDPNVVADVFRWMIERTLELEVRFLQQVAARP